MGLNFVSANSDTVDYGDNVNYDAYGTTMSINLWIRPDNWTQVIGLVNKWNNFQSQAAYTLGFNYLTAGQKISLQLGQNASLRYDWDVTGESLAKWRNVGVTFDDGGGNNNRAKLWLDGILQTAIVGVDSPTTIPATTSSLVLGRVNNTGSNYYDGDMAELAIWSSALSEDDHRRMAKGMSPLLVEPASITFRSSLRDATAVDVIQGITPTQTADLVADHPPVFLPTHPAWIATIAAPPVVGDFGPHMIRDYGYGFN